MINLEEIKKEIIKTIISHVEYSVAWIGYIEDSSNSDRFIDHEIEFQISCWTDLETIKDQMYNEIYKEIKSIIDSDSRFKYISKKNPNGDILAFYVKAIDDVQTVEDVILKYNVIFNEE